MSGLFDYAERNAFTDPGKQDHASGLFTKSGQNPRLGILDAFKTTYPVSDVDIHVYRDSKEPQKFNADAITKGNSIFLSSGSEELIRHELGHVLQQKEGMVTSGETVAGERVNKEEALERKADILGSRLPQEAVNRVMAESRTGMSLYGTQGIVQRGKTKKGPSKKESVQCGKTKKGSSKKESVQCRKTKKGPSKKESPPQRSGPVVLDLANLEGELKAGVDIANSNYNQAVHSRGTVPPNKWKYAWPVMHPAEELTGEAIGQQIAEGQSLVGSLIAQIGRDQFEQMSPQLQSHIYCAAVINRSNSATSVTGATGLHAYSDYFDNNGRFMTAGSLPCYIQPLGFIGNRTQIHILHWKHTGTDGEKCSTMLPNNMPEEVSRRLFEVAMAPGSRGQVREFEGFDFETRGSTLYPVGNNVKFKIKQDIGVRGTGAKKANQKKGRAAKPEEEVTLNQISEMLSELSGQDLSNRLSMLQGIGLYHPL